VNYPGYYNIGVTTSAGLGCVTAVPDSVPHVQFAQCSIWNPNQEWRSGFR